MTLATGRFRSEVSPVRMERKGWAERSPIERRSAVPEFRASRTRSLSRSSPPRIRQSPGFDALALMPSARTIPSAASASAPAFAPTIRVSPAARAPRRIARWVIDLSPGASHVPRRGRPGRVVARLTAPVP